MLVVGGAQGVQGVRRAERSSRRQASTTPEGTVSGGAVEATQSFLGRAAGRPAGEAALQGEPVVDQPVHRLRVRAVGAGGEDGARSRMPGGRVAGVPPVPPPRPRRCSSTPSAHSGTGARRTVISATPRAVAMCAVPGRRSPGISRTRTTAGAVRARTASGPDSRRTPLSSGAGSHEQPREAAEPLDGTRVGQLAEPAGDLDVWLLAGHGVRARAPGQLFSTALAFSPARRRDTRPGARLAGARRGVPRVPPRPGRTTPSAPPHRLNGGGAGPTTWAS